MKADAGPHRIGTFTGPEVPSLMEAADPHFEPDGELTAQVYAELRAMCAFALASERPDHTLQPTALANEVFLRLFGDGRPSDFTRSRFRIAASVAIQRILIDHARQRTRVKRGGTLKRRPLAADDHVAVHVKPEELVAINDLLEQFERQYPRQCRVVQLCFFGGYTQHEAAETLGVAERTIRNDWEFARAWFNEKLDRDDPER